MAHKPVSNLAADAELLSFINDEVLPGTEIAPDAFWSGLSQLVTDMAPRNAALLKKRDDMQARIDDWHVARKGKPIDPDEYENFLRTIGYLEPDPEPFAIDTSNVDDAIARIAGPQLVVPISIARYALNAANARWGSLYDALYGTDAISIADGAGSNGGYNPVRGAKVIARARTVLDEFAPLSSGTHARSTGYVIEADT